MASGIRSLAPEIDYVFSHESEATFPAFLASLTSGDPPDEPIVYGSPCRTMDDIPTPDYSEYYDQLDDFLPDSEIAKSGSLWLPYESSRGCWWGEKSHCTFCGINGGGMVFRQKTPNRVIEELQQLTKQHPTNKVCMVDNIMPHNYFDSLLPRLEHELPGLHLFYEQKANLTLEHVARLKSAGVEVIQPGIEALSTPLLKLMKKGVTAGQNIALLRYCRVVDLAVNWNLLFAFPSDQLQWYEDTLALMPLLVHLNPPTGLCHLSVDRFSPYFEQYEEYEIRSVRPMAAYFDVLPSHVDSYQIAYHFEGQYESGARANPAVIRALDAEIADWRERWDPSVEALPALECGSVSEDTFLLVDTRGLADCQAFEFIDLDRASMALLGRTVQPNAAAEQWALERKVCVELDGKSVPLATAPVSILSRFAEVVRAARREGLKLPILEDSVAALS